LKNLKITIVQPDTAWQNIDENLDRLETLIRRNSVSSDLIILPEMFSTGFTMSPSEAAEEMNGPSVKFLLRLSKELNTDITGSIAIRENNVYYNRVVWAKPGGEIFTYNKRHLFRMAAEHKVYEGGTSLLTVELDGWRIRPFVCYDLRFPVWTRNSGAEYDLALFISNWPASRSYHWDTLLRARAIENQCYVAGINRTGSDGNNLIYNGMSSVIDYCGNVMHRAGDSECVQTVELSFSGLVSYRETFPAWKDSDSFKIYPVKNNA